MSWNYGLDAATRLRMVLRMNSNSQLVMRYDAIGKCDARRPMYGDARGALSYDVAEA